MAAEARRAPRVISSTTSMAAAATIALQRHAPANPDLADAWVLLWEACGGSLYVDRVGRMVSQPAPGKLASVYQSIGAIPFCLDNTQEVAGALKALTTLLRIGGVDAADAIFAHASLATEA